MKTFNEKVSDFFNVIERKHADIEEKTPQLKAPEKIFHYCDVYALEGIVKNRDLWVGDAAYMNDRVEINYGTSIFIQAINNLIANKLGDDRYESLFPIFKRIEEYQRSSFDFTCSIACFSSVPDQLSQWRGYAANGHGYCVGFDAVRLAAMLGDTLEAEKAAPGSVDDFRTSSLKSVIYNRDTQESYVNECVSSWASELLIRFTEEELADNADVFVKAISALIFLIAPLFKHPGFAEEKEVRFVLIRGIQNSYQHESFRATTKGYFAPYWDFKPVDGHPLPITEIYLGPCQERKASRSLIALLWKHDLPNIPIHQSSVPFLV